MTAYEIGLMFGEILAVLSPLIILVWLSWWIFWGRRKPHYKYGKRNPSGWHVIEIWLSWVSLHIWRNPFSAYGRWIRKARIYEG